MIYSIASPPAPLSARRPSSEVPAAPVDSVVLGDGREPDDRKRITTLFLELTQVPGPSRKERPIADLLKQKIEAMGYTVREDGAGRKIRGNAGNLLVDVPGTVGDAPGLIFVAHMDTVRLAVGCKPQIKDGIIRSDGTTALGADDRAGCAELLEAMRQLKESGKPHGPLQFIFTVAEEAGLLGSEALERSDVHGHLGFVVDSFHPNELFFGWDGPLFHGELKHLARQRLEEEFDRPSGPADVLQPTNLAEGFLLDFTRAGIRATGLEPVERSLWGASLDAASLRGMGIPAITIGAGEQDIHSRSEHVSIDDLVKSTELIHALIDRATTYKVDSDGQIRPR